MGWGSESRKALSEEYITGICHWKWGHCHLRLHDVWDSAQEPVQGALSRSFQHLSGTAVTHRTMYCRSLLRRILALKKGVTWKTYLLRISWRSTHTQKEPHPRSLLPYWQLWLGFRGHLKKKPPTTIIYLHREKERKLLLDYLAIYDLGSKVLFFP